MTCLFVFKKFSINNPQQEKLKGKDASHHRRNAELMLTNNGLYKISLRFRDYAINTSTHEKLCNIKLFFSFSNCAKAHLKGGNFTLMYSIEFMSIDCTILLRK